VAKALWRSLLRARRSEGIGGEDDERGWRSMMGREEKEVVMMGWEIGTRVLLSVRLNDSTGQSEKGCFIPTVARHYDDLPTSTKDHGRFGTWHRILSPVVVGHQ
jgi:hypothetical protein